MSIQSGGVHSFRHRIRLVLQSIVTSKIYLGCFVRYLNKCDPSVFLVGLVSFLWLSISIAEERSCSLKSPSVCMKLADESSSKDSAAEMYAIACEAKISDGCYGAGMQTELDDNKFTAFRYYVIGCGLGSTNACGKLTDQLLMYQNNEIEKQISAAKVECAASDAGSCGRLGIYYIQKHMRREATNFFGKACAAQASDEARYCDTFLALQILDNSWRYMCGNASKAKLCLDESKKLSEKSEAARWVLSDLCDRESAKACVAIGSGYLSRDDKDLALVSFRKACLLGESSACHISNQLGAELIQVRAQDADDRRAVETERVRQNEERERRHIAQEAKRQKDIQSAVETIQRAFVVPKKRKKTCVSKQDFYGNIVTSCEED